MVSVCSRPPLFPSPLAVAWACVSCCFLITTPACCSSDAGGAASAAAAALHGQKRDIAEDIVARALFCFNDRYIYSGCQGSFRLGPEGALNVPRGSADAFCGGPCLPETELVLRCVDRIVDSFRFYNGASAGDVRFALHRGCARSGLRGDFDVRAHGHYYGDGYLYGRARSVNNNLPPLLLSAAAATILVWA